MKKILFVIMVTLYAAGAQAAEQKIGYIDLNKAMNESIEGKKARETLKGMVDSSEASIEKKRVEINKLEQEIIKQASILNPEAIKEKQDQLSKFKKDFQNMVKESQKKIDKAQSEFMKRILGDIGGIVSTIGREEGYTMIFEKMRGGIIYSPDNLDITERVIERFNEESQETRKSNE